MRFLSVLSELCGECFKFLLSIKPAAFQAGGPPEAEHLNREP